MRYQGRETLANTPLIEMAAIVALLCYLQQSRPFPFRLLYKLFDPTSRLYARAVANCTNKEIRRIVQGWAKLSPSAQRYELGGAERMFRTVLRSPAFALRCDGTFSAPDFLNHDDGGHILMEGGDGSKEARRVMLGAIVHHIIEQARRGAFQRAGGLIPRRVPSILWKDRYRRPQGIAALQSGHNVHLPIALERAEMREDTTQNVDRWEIHRCNSPETVRFFANMIAPLLADQPDTAEIQRQIQTLQPWERFVRERTAWKEYVPLLEEPYPWQGLTEKRTWEAVKESIGKHGGKLLSNGSRKTRVPRPKSAKPWNATTPDTSSPAIKLLRGISRDSNEKGKSA